MANPQQILAGIATTLASAITSGAQTTGIMVNGLPATYNNTSGVPTTATLSNNVQMVEGITFTGVTGSGPWTLVGVVRNTEVGGTAGTYANTSNIAIGSMSPGIYQTGLPYVLINGGGSVVGNLDVSGTLSSNTLVTTVVTTGSAFNTAGGAITLIATGATNVTLPTSGTLMTTAQQVVTSVTNGSGLNLSGGTLSFNGSSYVLTGSSGSSLTGITPSQIGIVVGSFSGTGTATTSFVVTIGVTQSGITYRPEIIPTSALAAAVWYISARTTTTFTVTYLAGLTGTVTFDWVLFP